MNPKTTWRAGRYLVLLLLLPAALLLLEWLLTFALTMTLTLLLGWFAPVFGWEDLIDDWTFACFVFSAVAVAPVVVMLGFKLFGIYIKADLKAGADRNGLNRSSHEI